MEPTDRGWSFPKKKSQTTHTTLTFRIEQLRVVAVHPDWYSGGVRVWMMMMMVIAGAATDGIDRGRRRRQRWEVRMVCRSRCCCRRCRVVMHRDRIGAGAEIHTATGGRCSCRRYCRGHCRYASTMTAAAG